MKRLLVSSAALLMATSVIAAAELESGLKVGDHAGAFNRRGPGLLLFCQGLFPFPSDGDPRFVRFNTAKRL